ncbi:hypothetical protein [Legionella parisiensis]|uniref:Uncharacterized protein n=1 Tax=Legionella parisiensis TaxID=45071 RepID=A0A1E5JNF0_9GAMM|nr:hypothetical protein [Legionella parisiensis]KTD42316.1 hypothetical protein Lpar_3633 [Legionella parisiensis]OEH45873.1 hypothetical protein lpari_03192 [Legionella parisiensis]STX72387.1 Uncharacterised protein [Legionella parisiensis]
MKFEKIETFLNRAGFRFIGQGEGVGAVTGRPSHLYQKNVTGSTPQMVQLAVSRADRDDIRLIFSNNVPQLVRDSIYNIFNENVLDNENTIRP